MTILGADGRKDLSGAPCWPVDAHVHLHRMDRVPDALDAAVHNFRVAVPEAGDLIGGLLLTQMSHEHVFEALGEAGEVGGWRFRHVAGEPQSLIASRSGSSVALICGRQVRAKGGLEIAALGTLDSFDDGRPFLESLREVLESGAIAAIPWGFGKWLGSRGRLLAGALASGECSEAFLGDSGSRLGMLREPRLIRESRSRGRRVLAGTDPFPFGGDHRRTGSFGFIATIRPDPTLGPWHQLRTWLHSPSTSPQTYGRPSSPLRFLVNQLGMQVYNRIPGRVFR